MEKNTKPLQTLMQTATPLEKWLLDPRAGEYFGGSFAMRLEILCAEFVTGESLASIARRHGKVRSTAHNQAVRLRKIFATSIPDGQVDCPPIAE